MAWSKGYYGDFNVTRNNLIIEHALVPVQTIDILKFVGGSK